MRISVVTATWNSEKTLGDTMRSVLAQVRGREGAGFEVEHIIVDGCSSDGTMGIVKGMVDRYRDAGVTLKWVSERDSGIYDAMNKGIGMATGEVVGLLNSDDFYTSDGVLARVASEFMREGDPRHGVVTDRVDPGDASVTGSVAPDGIDAVYGDIHYVDDGDLEKCVRRYSSKGFRRWKMRLGYMPAHPSFYCRRGVYERLGLFDTEFRIAADFEQLLRLIYINGIVARYVEMDFVTMRTGGASTSGLSSHRRIICEHIAAYRKNGVRSGWLHESVRYVCKGTALVWHRVTGGL